MRLQVQYVLLGSEYYRTITSLSWNVLNHVRVILVDHMLFSIVKNSGYVGKVNTTQKASKYIIP